MSIDISKHRDKTFIDARISKVIRIPELGECWEWKRARTSRGYGHFTVTVNGVARQVKAHRAAYEIFTGDRLLDREAMHKCDNTCCCNPSHVVPGTHQDNMTDMKRKGRAAGHVGTANPNTKLTLDQVSEIRVSPRGYGCNKRLAVKFNITPEHVYLIRSGKSWSAKKAA